MRHMLIHVSLLEWWQNDYRRLWVTYYCFCFYSSRHLTSWAMDHLRLPFIYRLSLMMQVSHEEAAEERLIRSHTERPWSNILKWDKWWQIYMLLFFFFPVVAAPKFISIITSRKELTQFSVWGRETHIRSLEAHFDLVKCFSLHLLVWFYSIFIDLVYGKRWKIFFTQFLWEYFGYKWQ